MVKLTSVITIQITLTQIYSVLVVAHDHANHQEGVQQFADQLGAQQLVEQQGTHHQQRVHQVVEQLGAHRVVEQWIAHHQQGA